MTKEPKSTQSNKQRPMRAALLLQWRERGYSRPPYGLVDDEELRRTGRSTFLGTDGRKIVASRADLLLLHPAANEPVELPAATADACQ